MKNQSLIRKSLNTVWLTLSIMFAVQALQASAQQPVTLVVPFAKGGPTDRVARPLATELGKALGQEVALTYDAGAGGTKAVKTLIQTAGEPGLRLLLHHVGLATAPALYRNLGFDPTKDLEPIGLVADAPMLILAQRGLPATDARSLASYARLNQRTLALAYAGPGSASQLCGLMLEDAWKINPIWVPYTGTATALQDLQAGKVDLLCDQTTSALPVVNRKTVTAFAVTAKKRIPVMPDLATTAEAGYAQVQLVIWHGLYAPIGTPPETIAQISRALQSAVAAPAFTAAMQAVAAIPVQPGQATPAALRSQLQSETARMKTLIAKSGQYAD